MQTAPAERGGTQVTVFGPARMFWTGVALYAAVIVADIALTTMLLDAATGIPPLAGAIISRVTTLLTVLGPMMIVGALVVDLIGERRDPSPTRHLGPDVGE